MGFGNWVRFQQVKKEMDFIFLGSQITLNSDCRHTIKSGEQRSFWKESYDKLRQHIKKQRHHFANKGLSSQSYGFSRSHVWMWELDHKEAWALKNWCFQTVVLEKTLESPLDCKKIKPVHPKGNQHWMFVGRTDAKAEALILWSPYVEGHSLQKTLMLGKIEGKRRRGRGGWGGLIILGFQ